MQELDFLSIKNDLASKMPVKRFEHTLGVVYTAAALAMKYQGPIEKAMLAGLLHDASKAYPREKYVEMAHNWSIPVSEIETEAPELLHGKLSVYIASNEYGITDKEILDAIACHTTGKPQMTLLDKILYIADYIEPSRKLQARLNIIRESAFCNLDETLKMILEDTLNYLKTTPYVIDPMTEKTYLYYSGEM